MQQARVVVLCLLFACEAPGVSQPATKGKSLASASQAANPWYWGVFLGENRARLALLPDGTMLFPPMYLGAYTVTDNALAFTPSTGGSALPGTLLQEKDGLTFRFNKQDTKLKRAVSFSRYPGGGNTLTATLASLAGTWRQVAHAGAPMSDWERASNVLGPSLAPVETLTFSGDTLTQTIGTVSRQEQIKLDQQTLTRTPNNAGYSTKQEVRLYQNRLELGPTNTPDIYIRN